MPESRVPQTPLKTAKRARRKINRRSIAPSETVMVALDNPNGLCWVMEYAPIYATILQGIESELTARGKQMQVCSIRSREEFEGLVRGRPPDGLLFLASKNVVSLKESIGLIPCVSVLGNSCEGYFDQVTYNNTTTGRLPAEFFTQRGITCAAILGPTEPGRNTTFGTRYSSFCEAMEDAGAKVIKLLSDELYEPGNPSNQPRAAEIARLVRQLKNSRPSAGGLFVMADNMLPSVYKHLTEAGIMPGKDVQVVSCNSESPYYSGLPCPPAQVDIPAHEIGRRGVEILDWRIKNPGRPTGTTVLHPTLNIPPQSGESGEA
jgi:DNA-binding LacI/PurR family transcriptional regulator